MPELRDIEAALGIVAFPVTLEFADPVQVRKSVAGRLFQARENNFRQKN